MSELINPFMHFQIIKDYRQESKVEHKFIRHYFADNLWCFVGSRWLGWHYRFWQCSLRFP